MEHRKLDALMTPVERIARVAAAGVNLAKAPQTAPSGAISLDNADGTRTIIGEVVNGEDNPSYTMATHVGDTTPPGVPTGITATSKSGVVVVEWDGTLDGGIPDDFFCVRVYLDNVELGALTEAGSVASAKLDGGTTVLVTATSEDDCCLPDGTPDHNVSQASQAISITVAASAAEIIVDVEDEIEGIQQEITDFKGQVQANYYTKTTIDEKTEAITNEVDAVYRDSMARNLSPFYSHDFTDVSTIDPEAYWHTLTTAKTEQLSDGWAHVTLDNASGTGGMYAYATVRAPFLPIVAGTLMVEIRNVQVTAAGRWGIGRTVQGLTFTALDVTEDGTYYRPCTVNDPAPANGVAMSLRFYAFAGVSVEFDARLSYYQGEYTGAYKQFNADTANLTREYATKTWTEQTAEDYSLAAAQKYTATIANANLSPLTAHDTKDRYNATTNPEGYWVANIAQYENIEDGWVHVERAAASGTQWAQQFETVLLANLKPSTKYTLLMEYRNVSVTGTLTGWAVYRSTTQFAQPVDNSFAISEDMAKRVVIETKADYEGITSGIDVRHRLVAPSGGDGSCSYDIRLSLYECATNSEGKTIPYDGPYKPYVTDQQALSKEYATQSQLTVGINGIRTEVSQTYETQSHANTTYSTKTELQQTASGLDTRITANATNISGEILARETLIRQYANGVLVCKVGESVGALVNASGSFDVVSVTWSGDEPTVGTTAASFTATDLLLGLQANDASVSLLGGTGSLSASNDWTEQQVYGLTLRGPNALGIHTGASRAVGMSAEKAWRRYITPDGSRTVDDTYLRIAAPHVVIAGGETFPIIFKQMEPDLSEGGTGEMTENAKTVHAYVPQNGIFHVEGIQLGGYTDGTSYWNVGTPMRGVYFGSKVVNPAGAAYATLFTAAEAEAEFGIRPNAARDVVLAMNGDAGAYQGQLTAALTGGEVRVYPNPTKNGNIRVNYIVIIGA